MSTFLDRAFQEAVDQKQVPAVGAIALDTAGNVLYKGAYGSTNVDDASAAKFTTSTQHMIFSCTKIVTAIATLQLVEKGKLSLDDLVEKHVPIIKDIQVLDGFDADGKAVLRAQKIKPTILNLITHTAGFTYDFTNEDTLKWRIGAGQGPAEYIAKSTLSNYQTPLVHDAGAKWTYGVNYDWLGMAIEKVTNQKLEEYCAEHVLTPLGMTRTGRVPIDGEPILAPHIRGRDGKLSAHPELAAPKERGEVVGGGHFLWSTLDDYAQLLLTVLNNGTHPSTRHKILEASTVQDYLFTDFTPQTCGGNNEDISNVASAIPELSNTGHMLPNIKKGWSCGLMLNHEAVPNGRAKGSAAWCGYANMYYWIDRTSGKLGVITSELSPYWDTKMLQLFDAFESQVYGKDSAEGSRYVVTNAIDSSG